MIFEILNLICSLEKNHIDVSNAYLIVSAIFKDASQEKEEKKIDELTPTVFDYNIARIPNAVQCHK